jgi:hypothetical protein
MIQSYGVRKPWATGIILSNYVRQLPKGKFEYRNGSHRFGRQVDLM